MDLISLYLDEQTNRMIQKWISKVSEASHNDYMTNHHVPVHLTLLGLDTRNAAKVIQVIENMELNTFDIYLAGIISLSQGVLGISVVYSEELYTLHERLYSGIKQIEETEISHFYLPFSYMPHITIAKKLKHEQLISGFAELSDLFHPIRAKVIRLGFSKVNPYQELCIQELKKI